MCAKPGPRRAIADMIEHLIALLDQIDGDPDFELEPIEEQWDLEADLAVEVGPHRASMNFVLAEMSRRKRKVILH
ncbi:hypothetical protein D8676_21885 [Mesorhizobium sp. YM1C-6-2]|nr:hypothetical protein D8676_21885 [Mesorhizobium sp. YM1C-6-2]